MDNKVKVGWKRYMIREIGAVNVGYRRDVQVFLFKYCNGSGFLGQGAVRADYGHHGYDVRHEDR